MNKGRTPNYNLIHLDDDMIIRKSKELGYWEDMYQTIEQDILELKSIRNAQENKNDLNPVAEKSSGCAANKCLFNNLTWTKALPIEMFYTKRNHYIDCLECGKTFHCDCEGIVNSQPYEGLEISYECASCRKVTIKDFIHLKITELLKERNRAEIEISKLKEHQDKDQQIIKTESYLYRLQQLYEKLGARKAKYYNIFNGN